MFSELPKPFTIIVSVALRQNRFCFMALTSLQKAAFIKQYHILFLSSLCVSSKQGSRCLVLDTKWAEERTFQLHGTSLYNQLQLHF